MKFGACCFATLRAEQGRKLNIRALIGAHYTKPIIRDSQNSFGNYLGPDIISMKLREKSVCRTSGACKHRDVPVIASSDSVQSYIRQKNVFPTP